MTTQITSAAGLLDPSDLGKSLTIGSRRLVWPWWAMFAHWEVEERPIERILGPHSALLGQPVWRRSPLDWQR